MQDGLKPRVFWACCVVAIIAAGVLSRVVHTGLAVWDKYLGDALYAAMAYAILRLFTRRARAALWAGLILLSLELFQLTMIPAGLAASDHFVVRMCARLLGTEFSGFDLLAYGVGIGGIYAADPDR